jgi:hypothetical protein
MNPILTAKIRVGNLENNTTSDGAKTQETITCYGVYNSDPTSENYSWSKATPALNLNMVINNEAAFGLLEQGKEYYLQFVPVEEKSLTQNG